MMPLDLLGSLAEIAGRIDDSGSLLLGLDFDGTLTPIRTRPELATLDDSVRAVLARLARQPHVTVMIASGRSLMDVSSRVGLSGLIYAGNHGLEIRGGGLNFVEPTAEAWANSLRELTLRLEALVAEVPGAVVEQKGLTTSVHYRNVPVELWELVSDVVHDVVGGDADRFIVTGGNRIWEIRPRVDWNKGRALHWVIERIERPGRTLVFYIGDDRTDEDAFVAHHQAVTVKVGPEWSPTAARYKASDPVEVEKFLNWLADHLACRKGP